MSRNYYSELNFHIVWHTKNSAPLLTPDVEPLARRILRKRIVDNPGAFVHEIGGTENHVHLAVTLPPTILLSHFIGQLKGGSTHDVNEQIGAKAVQWQAGYGALTFGTRDLNWVVQYIRNQREHHARRSTHERLERMTQNEIVSEGSSPLSEKARERASNSSRRQPTPA